VQPVVEHQRPDAADDLRDAATRGFGGRWAAGREEPAARCDRPAELKYLIKRNRHHLNTSDALV
jgi:hypothetical protein